MSEGMIPNKYEAAITETLVDLRTNGFGGDRTKCYEFLYRTAARFVGEGMAEILIRRALLELKGQVSTDVVPTTPLTPTVGSSTPSTCGCDLSQPLIDDPESIYNDMYGSDALSHAGNSEECPVALAGKDIRCSILGTGGKRPQIASWCEGHYHNGGAARQVVCDCFTLELNGRNYTVHFTGWGKSGKAPENQKNPLVYDGTTFAFWEMRKA